MTLVQSDCTDGTFFTGNTGTFTYPGALTAGNLVVVTFMSGDNRSLTSMTGTTTTFTAPTPVDGGFGRLFFGRAIAGGADTTVTIVLSGAEGNATDVCFAEFSGAAADQSATTENGTYTSATTHDSGSVTPPTAVNVVVAFTVHGNGDFTYDSGFTEIEPGANKFFGYILQTSATAQEINHTSVDTEVMGTIIRALVGTASASVPKLTLLGAGGAW